MRKKATEREVDVQNYKRDYHLRAHIPNRFHVNQILNRDFQWNAEMHTWKRNHGYALKMKRTVFKRIAPESNRASELERKWVHRRKSYIEKRNQLKNIFFEWKEKNHKKKLFQNLQFCEGLFICFIFLCGKKNIKIIK